MKTAFKLAYRNLIGAGIRTWLNVIVLSFSFVVIIWLKGIMVGWDHQAKRDMTNWEIGGGQYWHQKYDPYDPFTLSESRTKIPPQFQEEIERGDMEPILIIQGTIYPQGRMQSAIIKGIRPSQTILSLPTAKLDTSTNALPSFIGRGMAENLNLSQGDHMTIRWRDANGTFDATEVVIVEIFTSNVPAVENGQIYVPLEKLREMTGLEGEATLLTLRDIKENKTSESTGDIQDKNNNTSAKQDEISSKWVLKTKSELTASVDKLIQTKTAGQSIFYVILLLLAMLAIFDTQVLSIFRRQKEIGTYVALGYTRKEVVALFTVEGAMHSILAALVAALYGIPFLVWQAKSGWTIPVEASDYGMAMAQTLYPVYTTGLVTGTVLIVVLTTTIVSYWPSRKIAKMNPTEALRGKIQ
jgi:ABC-type lipoprotein release transport system permease subunit